MSGFPSRLFRSFFGPRFRDARPVENPETEVSADALNPLLWQVAGLNQTASRAAIIASWDGATFDVSFQGEAWNANGSQDHPELARASAGVYTYTFAATYLDEAEEEVAINLLAARIHCLKPLTVFADRVSAHAWRDPDSATVIHVRLWDEATGTAVDQPFWLEVF